MAYTLSGTVCIPSEDFWSWVQKSLPELAELDQIIEPESLAILSLDGILSMRATKGTSYEIDSIDFWRFVSDYHPNFSPGRAFFGVPRLNESDHSLIVPFFATTSSNQNIEHPVKELVDKGWKVLRKRAPLIRQEYWFDK